MAEKSTKLTPKQRAFVDAYLGEAQGNGTQAARMAGYKGSDATLGQVAGENLKKPAIAAEVQRRQQEREKRAEITAAKMAADLAELLELDWLDCFEVDGNGKATFKRLDKIPKAFRKHITELRRDEAGEVFRAKLESKAAARTLLAKMSGWLVQKHHVSGPDGGPIEVGVKAVVKYYFPGKGRLKDAV